MDADIAHCELCGHLHEDGLPEAHPRQPIGRPLSPHTNLPCPPCAVCGDPQYTATGAIHECRPKPRTVRVRIAVAAYKPAALSLAGAVGMITASLWSDEDVADAYAQVRRGASMDGRTLLGAAIVAVSLPLDEIVTVESSVVAAREASGGGK